MFNSSSTKEKREEEQNVMMDSPKAGNIKLSRSPSLLKLNSNLSCCSVDESVYSRGEKKIKKLKKNKLHNFNFNIENQRRKKTVLDYLGQRKQQQKTFFSKFAQNF